MSFLKTAESVVRRMIFRRFEAAELLLAFSVFFHSVWLLLPEWTPGGSLSDLPRIVEVIGGWIMLLLSGAHIPIVIYDWRDRLAHSIRKILSMSSFMGHAFLLGLVSLSIDFASLYIIPYLVLTLLGALAYLSMSVMHDE